MTTRHKLKRAARTHPKVSRKWWAPCRVFLESATRDGLEPRGGSMQVRRGVPSHGKLLEFAIYNTAEMRQNQIILALIYWTFLLDYTHGHEYWQTGLALGAGQVSHPMDEPILPRRQPCSPFCQPCSAPRRFCQAEGPSVYREGHAPIVHSATFCVTHTGQVYIYVKYLLASSTLHSTTQLTLGFRVASTCGIFEL